jgi:hypothetical protein
VRDDLPDLLWPILTLSELGTHEAFRFVRWQKSVQADLGGQAAASFIAECLDGRLTGLDRLVAQVPSAQSIIKKHATELELLSPSVATALSTYPSRPAEWLTGLEIVGAEQAEIDLLATAVLQVLKDGHREAVIKCLFIWSAVQAGTFSTSAETIKLLKDYPNDTSTRSRADSVIRACWGAHRGLLDHQHAEHFAETIKWAKVFWSINSMTTSAPGALSVSQAKLHLTASSEVPMMSRLARISA